MLCTVFYLNLWLKYVVKYLYLYLFLLFSKYSRVPVDIREYWKVIRVSVIQDEYLFNKYDIRELLSISYPSHWYQEHWDNNTVNRNSCSEWILNSISKLNRLKGTWGVKYKKTKVLFINF